MTEMHELNRLVICLFYAASGVMRRAKSPRTVVMTDSVGKHRSHIKLSVGGALRQSTGVVSDSFFESDRRASEAVGSALYDEI